MEIEFGMKMEIEFEREMKIWTQVMQVLKTWDQERPAFVCNILSLIYEGEKERKKEGRTPTERLEILQRLVKEKAILREKIYKEIDNCPWVEMYLDLEGKFGRDLEKQNPVNAEFKKKCHQFRINMVQGFIDECKEKEKSWNEWKSKSKS